MKETEKIWMSGELVDWADAKVHVGVHGLHYGSGVFEGIRCYETATGPAVFRLTDHLQRLHNSARLIQMEIPYSVEEIHAACNELIGVNGLPESYLRPIAFYGYGELGVRPARLPGRGLRSSAGPGAPTSARARSRTGSARRSRAGSASARTSSRTSPRRPAST